MFSARFPRTAALVLSTLLIGGCSSGAARPDPQAMPASLPSPSQAGRRVGTAADVVALYRRQGLLAEGGETPFVGNLAFLAGKTPDSTLMMLTVSMSNRSLRFGRDGDRYRAGYSVTLDISRGATTVANIRTHEDVRVLAFRETQRNDESVLFRRYVTLAPGTYDLRLHLKGDSATVGTAIEATIGVPRFGEGAISTPVAVYQANLRTTRDSLPRVVQTPRSTMIFGRDTILPVYVEGYGSGATYPVRVSVKAEGADAVLWSDSTSLVPQQNIFSGIVNVPVSRLGVGVMSIGVSRIGGTDTLRTPLFVAFGEDMPVASFADMMDYLRYYASAARLNAMRDAPPAARAALWAAFVKETDPAPETPVHEGLRDYFARITQANLRFRDDVGPGWLTDRGRVFVAFGAPDQILEPTGNDFSQRGRTQLWDYRQHRLRLIFVDPNAFGRWQLTLASEAEFEAAARRVLVP